MAHPGELATAETFCTWVQRELSAKAQAGGSLQVCIISTVHTDMTAFMQSQPTIQLCACALLASRTCHA